MDTCALSILPGGDKAPAPFFGNDSALDADLYLTGGQRALLDRIPESGDVIALSSAVEILSARDVHSYGLIVALMNRGVIAADFIDAPWVDPDIVLRRI